MNPTPDSGPRPRDLGRAGGAAATLLGSGLSPIAPGTAGSALALAPLFLLPDACWPWVPLAGSVAATLLCVALARKLPAKGSGGDPGWFVLDEAAGMWLAAAAIAPPSALRLLVAFVLFRVLDATKPPPLRRLEHAGSGWGIVLDDLGAGGYALALTVAIAHVLTFA